MEERVEVAAPAEFIIELELVEAREAAETEPDADAVEDEDPSR